MQFLAGAISLSDATLTKSTIQSFFAMRCYDFPPNLPSTEFVELLFRFLNECSGYLVCLPALERVLQDRPAILQMKFVYEGDHTTFPIVCWLAR
jgi:hypothetical protein